MKRTYIVSTNSEPKIYQKDTLLVFAEARCQYREVDTNNAIKNHSNSLCGNFIKILSLPIKIGWNICKKIPFLHKNIKKFWCKVNYTSEVYAKFVEKATIFVYLCMAFSGVVCLNTYISLFAGIWAFLLSIFLLEYFQKYGNGIFWILLSLAGAVIGLLLLIPLSKIINIPSPILMCFSISNLGNSLTFVGLLISIISNISR